MKTTHEIIEMLNGEIATNLRLMKTFTDDYKKDQRESLYRIADDMWRSANTLEAFKAKIIGVEFEPLERYRP